MSYRNRLCILIFPIIFFISCKKNVPISEPDETIIEPIEVTNFSFLVKDNPDLPANVLLEQKEQQFVGMIPAIGTNKLIATFSSNADNVSINGVAQKSGVTVNNFEQEVSYTFVGKNKSQKIIKVKVTWQPTDVPHIRITTNNGMPITSKENYLQANLQIDGKGRYADFSGSTEVKGRGNSTWVYPKKPYRLKLTNKAEILGLPSAKNWVLLANYLDPSLMSNAVAMKIGRDLEVPFTNTIIPVDVSVNGKYMGSYSLTQQVEVNENRVNIGNDGYLLELDTYYDETHKFYSAGYNLPVMIKEPELADASGVAAIKYGFEGFEALIKGSTFPNTSYGEYFDIDVFARYILVYFLTGNEEVNHPKSVYMHKKMGGKFSFGPLWDFDWAYGYESGAGHFSNAMRPLFWSGSAKGTIFFKRLFEDPAVQAAFKKHWTNYKKNHMSQLITYIDEYAAWIKSSKARDYELWGKGKDFASEISKLKKYIQDRTLYIDNFVK